MEKKFLSLKEIGLSSTTLVNSGIFKYSQYSRIDEM